MDSYDLKELIDNINEDNITHVFIEWENEDYHNEFQYHKSLKIKEDNMIKLNSKEEN